MVERIRISSDERKRLSGEGGYAPPKYTFYALNAAAQYSGANKKSSIGDISEIYSDFKEEHPRGDFSDWKAFYLQDRAGEERLEQAVDDMYSMFLKIRESIEQIDRSDVQYFVENLVLNETYSKHNPREAIAEKVKMANIEGSEYPIDGEADELVHMRYAGHPVTIQPRDFEPDTLEGRDNLRILYYTERDDGSLEVDLTELNQDINDF